MVVDDDADWRDFLRICLEDLGYPLIEAASGPEALAKLAEEPCDVLVLDLHMPGLSGADLLGLLPEGGPRVVLLTSAPIQEVKGALGSGPHYYLPKGARREAISLILESLAG